MDGRHSSYYSQTSVSKPVGWKLYDPEGYLIDDGTFYTPSMLYGDKFRDKEIYIGYDKCTMRGEYKLKLMNSR